MPRRLMFINFSLTAGAIKPPSSAQPQALGRDAAAEHGTGISNAKDDLSNFFFWEVGDRQRADVRPRPRNMPGGGGRSDAFAGSACRRGGTAAESGYELR